LWRKPKHGRSNGGSAMFWISCAGSVFGLFFDSLLGATLERRGWLNEMMLSTSCPTAQRGIICNWGCWPYCNIPAWDRLRRSWRAWLLPFRKSERIAPIRIEDVLQKTLPSSPRTSLRSLRQNSVCWPDRLFAFEAHSRCAASLTEAERNRLHIQEVSPAQSEAAFCQVAREM